MTDEDWRDVFVGCPATLVLLIVRRTSTLQHIYPVRRGDRPFQAMAIADFPKNSVAVVPRLPPHDATTQPSKSQQENYRAPAHAGPTRRAHGQFVPARSKVRRDHLTGRQSSQLDG